MVTSRDAHHEYHVIHLIYDLIRHEVLRTKYLSPMLDIGYNMYNSSTGTTAAVEPVEALQRRAVQQYSISKDIVVMLLAPATKQDQVITKMTDRKILGHQACNFLTHAQQSTTNKLKLAASCMHLESSL